jgi:hypothetical protein
MRAGRTLKGPKPLSLTAEALRPRTLRIPGLVARMDLIEFETRVARST